MTLADFRTHLYGATAVSAVAAVSSLALGWSSPGLAQLSFVAGVIGGLMPDLDSDGSTPLRVAFSVLSAAVAFVAAFAWAGQLSLAELLLIWFGVFALVRFGVFELFTRLTVHRGSFHSLLAVALSGIGGAALAGVSGYSAVAAWTLGGFLAMGYLTHLILDEFYSVDLLGLDLKASFGTALKPLSLAYPFASMWLAVLLGAAIWWSPSVEPLLQHWQQVSETKIRILPTQWFEPLHGFLAGL